jgi:sugar O-acyltransferase (sialic acid O-acetyltransferase NeuD family)
MAAPGASAPLLIFPCNGNGVEAIGCLGPRHRLLGFINDGPPRAAYTALGPSIWGREALRDMPEAAVLAVPGNAENFRVRRALIDGLDVDPRRFAQVVHERATVSPLARLGHNVLIMAGVVICGNAVIGDHVCILPNSVVHHDSHIGDGTLVGSQVTVAGHVQIGENCYLGSGSTIKNGLVIGAGTLVGLGSCVLHDTAPGSVVAGSPARRLH